MLGGTIKQKGAGKKKKREGGKGGGLVLCFGGKDF